MQHLFRPSPSIALLRIAMGLVFISHAAARLIENTLPGFGGFLDSKGFPAGYYMAWAVTIFEFIGGIMMVLRKFVKWFCVGEIVILLTGIVIVHAANGWFVVGMTLGGVEYSVVLIIVLIAVFLAEWKEERRIAVLL